MAKKKALKKKELKKKKLKKKELKKKESRKKELKKKKRRKKELKKRKAEKKTERTPIKKAISNESKTAVVITDNSSNYNVRDALARLKSLKTTFLALSDSLVTTSTRVTSLPVPDDVGIRILGSPLRGTISVPT